MSEWSIPYSFAVFFTAVYVNNSHLSQYEDISLLINDERLNVNPTGQSNPKYTEIFNHYARGRRAVGRVKASAMAAQGEEKIAERINQSGLYEKTAGARCLYQLLQSGRLIVEDGFRTSMLSFPYQEKPVQFLAAMLLQAVRCPQKDVRVLSPEIVQDILSYRKDQTAGGTAGSASIKNEPPSEEMRQNSAPASGTAGETTVQVWYESRRLRYETDFKRLDKLYEDFVPFDEAMKIGQGKIAACRYAFSRAEASFEINARGPLAGITDMFISRISPGQCSQLVFLVKMARSTPLSPLRKALLNIIHYALAADGEVLFSYSIDNSIPQRQYDMKIVYSLEALSETDKLRQTAIDGGLRYSEKPFGESDEGRIPAFFTSRQDTPDSFLIQQQKLYGSAE